jgi:hypothetical protein
MSKLPFFFPSATQTASRMATEPWLTTFTPYASHRQRMAVRCWIWPGTGTSPRAATHTWPQTTARGRGGCLPGPARLAGGCPDLLGREEEARGGAREAAVACPAAGRGHLVRGLQRAREEEARGSKREAATVSFESVTVYLHLHVLR